MSKIDSILFDLDGTLWSSAKAISEAWGLVLQKHEDIEKKEVTEEELYSCMGLPMYDIAAKLFPSTSCVNLKTAIWKNAAAFYMTGWKKH